MIEFIKKLLDSLQFFIFAAVFFIVIWIFVLSPRKVDGISMWPTLHNEDFVVVYKLAYLNEGPKRGDIVVFKRSAVQDLIKRVIGLPGETIMVEDGNVYINGEKLDESAYLSSGVKTQAGTFLKEGIPFAIPEGQYILIGDNRPYSGDSREIGSIPLQFIEARSVFIWYPLQRVGALPQVNYTK